MKLMIASDIYKCTGWASETHDSFRYLQTDGQTDIAYHITDVKQQNHLKVGTDEPKLKVKMKSVSDDDVWKRLLE